MIPQNKEKVMKAIRKCWTKFYPGTLKLIAIIIVVNFVKLFMYCKMLSFLSLNFLVAKVTHDVVFLKKNDPRV